MDTRTAIANVKTVQAALCVISAMNINAPVFPPNFKACNGSCFDYIVVGGGIGGSVVTGRLVEAGYSVLLLEAGGLANVESNLPGWVTFVNLNWRYSPEIDEKCDKCHQASGLAVPKALGGASVTGYMVYNRGNPSNFDKWSKTTKDSSWSWENMQKYFKKGERFRDVAILNSPYGKYHATDGKMFVSRDTNDVCDEYIEGFKKAGQPTPLDNIGNASLGYSRGLYFIYDALYGDRNDAAYAYMYELRDNPKIHVSLHSLVTKILFDDKKNAVGVEFIKCGKKIIVKARKEVIVSAGPFKSPQLLMLSGIGPEEELKKFNIKSLSSLPVGKHLQNVESVLLTFKTNKKSEPIPLDPYKFISPLVIGFATTNESSKYPDYKTLNFIVQNGPYFLPFCGFTLTLKNEICDKLYQKAANTQLLTSLLIDFDIKAKGEITLKSANPKDAPKIKVAHYSSDGDLDSLVKKIKHFMKIVSTPYFKEMGLEFMDPVTKCGQLKKDSNEYWKCYALCMSAATGYFVGSNSMGAVVDNKFCVKGIKKLRVVDASVIPNLISGFTQAVVVAVAEKAAEIIIADGK